MGFINTTVFIAPICYQDMDTFTAALHTDDRWSQIHSEELATAYLVSYAQCLLTDQKRYRGYWLRMPDRLDVCMFNKTGVHIAQVRLSCFGTGTGFMEFFVHYDGAMTVEDIADFSYLFKKASRADSPSRDTHGWKGQSLYDTILELLPKNSVCQPFFTSTAAFKRECYCFHAIKTVPEAVTAEHLSLLKRSYSTDFQSGTTGDSRYDMTYVPYLYDMWGGSQEALVNLCYAPENPQTKRFIEDYKYGQLMNDYLFCYLLLLDQRFSMIRHIQQIAQVDEPTAKQMQQINEAIVRLKTGYAFRVISGDMIYQNVYSRMYDILDVDHLMEDVQDSEAQLAMIRDIRALQVERDTNHVLSAISLLSLFSALIDAASYFDRFGVLGQLSTLLSLGCVVAIGTFCIAWIIRHR
jgi:uncharacterized membrane protein (DUF485 family)